MSPVDNPPFSSPHQNVPAAPFQNHQPTERRRKNGYIEEEKNCMHMLHQSSQPHLRYNNTRPNYQTYNRVPERLFPDPTKFGWKFTGSSEQDMAEFYEKESEHGRVLLNFYFNSGTIRVVLIHAVEGEMQLFKKGRSLLPNVYKNVLEDPIMNTDAKYRRRGTQKILI
jgi:hypothetical protein